MEFGDFKNEEDEEVIELILCIYSQEACGVHSETLADDLSYGTYTIRESVTNNTYQRTDKEEKTFEITKDGELVWKTGDNEISFYNYVYRGDLQGTKIGDGDSDRFGYVPFKVTMKKTGESKRSIQEQHTLKCRSLYRRSQPSIRQHRAKSGRQGCDGKTHGMRQNAGYQAAGSRHSGR